MAKTKIEWCDETWNPVTGCSPISEGCDHCYAERMSVRLKGRCGYPSDEPFRVTLHPDRLDHPMRMKKPKRIFVCSMGDLFHDDVPFDYIAAIYGVMAACPQHTFMVLTKRPKRAFEWYRWVESEGRLTDGSMHGDLADYAIRAAKSLPLSVLPIGHTAPWPLPNVLVGVTAENQARADERTSILLQIPAALHWVSAEPMLGPIWMKNLEPDWSDYCEIHDYGMSAISPAECPNCSFGPSIGFVVAGGETGHHARPMHPDWVRSIRYQCIDEGVPFFFKGWGGKEKGRLLDGQEWNQTPGRNR